jgi:hypothetical protein
MPTHLGPMPAGEHQVAVDEEDTSVVMGMMGVPGSGGPRSPTWVDVEAIELGRDVTHGRSIFVPGLPLGQDGCGVVLEIVDGMIEEPRAFREARKKQ